LQLPDESDTTPPPSLSIIIPALEPDLELRRCLDSIALALSGTGDYEVVLVMPARNVERARAQFPSVRVECERRRGIYSAMNDGAVASRGCYLLFLGKDDIVLPTLQQVLSLLPQKPSAVFCDVYWGDRGVYRGVPSRWRVLGRNLCHQGIVYARTTFECHGPYLRRLRVQADHLLNIRLLWDPTLAAGVRYIDKPLTWYSGSGFSDKQRDPIFWRLYPTVMRRYVGAWAACALTFYRRLRGR
jgi:glycosyltransferase involved in cell wall biosynthesis